MEQLALNNVGTSPHLGRFTFALHKLETGVSVYSIGRTSRWREKRENVGLCVLFSPPLNDAPNDTEYLKLVMRVPFIPQLVDPKGPIWFQQRRRFTVVSNHLDWAFRVSTAEAGTGLGLLQRKNGEWESTIWPYFELFKYCFNLEKIASSCGNCIHDGSECVQYCIQSMCGETGLPEPKLPIENDRALVIDDLEVDDVIKLCKKVSRNSAWEFAHPKDATLHEFAPRLLQLEEIYFNEVDTCREERCERAQRAANTQKAVKRCKKECVFEESCEWCTRPYHGRPWKCQNKDKSLYGSLDILGPYNQEQFTDAHQRFWNQLPHIDRRKVELIAYNGGITTYVFGYELVLSKMNKLMDAVEFVRPRTGEVRLVDFEEAVLLCTTPYRDHDDVYIYPHRLSGWTERYWDDDPVHMPDDEFFTYVEICQQDCTLQGGWGYSNDYPSIQEVRWSPGAVHFETNKSWCTGNAVADVFEFTRRFSRHQFPITAKFLRSKEEVEKAGRATNLNTRP